MPQVDGGYLTAEQLFDQLNQQYEDTFADNPGLVKSVKKLIGMLPPGAKVLDVGCGTGRPTCELLAKAGLDVHGIDISEKMVEIARRNVPRGTFNKADMTKYRPEVQFDAVLSILNLFQSSHNKVRAYVAGFAEWLKPNGVFLLCMNGGECREPDLSLYDPEWGYIDESLGHFMGCTVRDSMVTTDGWFKLVKTTGLEIISSDVIKFKPETGRHKEEPYLYIFARKGDLHPLFGPHPLPETYRGPHLTDPVGKVAFESCLSEATSPLELRDNERILYMDALFDDAMLPVSKTAGTALERPAKHSARHNAQNGFNRKSPSIGQLPYSDKSFDAVVASGVLHHTVDLIGVLNDMVRVLDTADPNARIVLYQAAPYNQVVELLNRHCVPINTISSRQADHQGYLLQTATQVFKSMGLGSIEVSRTESRLEFDGAQNVETASKQAAEIISGLWYSRDPAREDMETRLVEDLKKRFQHQIDLCDGGRLGKYTIGNDEVVLIARPGGAASTNGHATTQ